MDFPDDEVFLDASQSIDEDRAVKMVHFVLKRPRQKVAPLDGAFCAGSIEASNDRARGANDRGVEPRKAEAAFFFELHPVAFDEDWVDHDNQILSAAAERDIDDKDTPGHADLSGRKAHARSRVHRFDHVVDEALDIVVDRRDVHCRLMEGAVSVAQNWPNHKE